MFNVGKYGTYNYALNRQGGYVKGSKVVGAKGPKYLRTALQVCGVFGQ